MNGAALFFAFLLDLILGDPRGLPHPVRWIGACAERTERAVRRIAGSGVFSGAVALGLLLITWVLPAFLLLRFLAPIPVLKMIISVVVIYYCLSVRDLLYHAYRVFKALREADDEDARKWVSYLVSRDTEVLDRDGLIISTVESVSENISDGITGILFYTLLLGPAGALLFRLTNTLDAMWGYKNEEYLQFGRAAARLDDLLGWIPARLTAMTLVAAAWITGRDFRSAWRILRRDGRKHESPNSGLPEAAVAGALGIRFGGLLSYYGRMSEKPFIGDHTGRKINEDLILEAGLLAVVSTMLLLGALSALWFGIYRMVVW